MPTKTEKQAKRPEDMTGQLGLIPVQDTTVQNLIEQALGTIGTRTMHNFGTDKMQVWKRSAMAESGKMKKMQDMKDKTFKLCYFYVQQVQIVDERTGEISEPCRVVLMDDQFDGVAFVSDGIAKSLAKIIQTFGMGPYHPPLNIEIEEIQTRRGHRLYNIIPA